LAKGGKVVIVGAGFSGLSAAVYLAHKGFEVVLIEKHKTPGGRARKLESEGYLFDMGPSWYWMPDIFETWFRQFDKSPSDYYNLVRLDPSYRVFYDINNYMDIPSGINKLSELFESLEPGAANNLKAFMVEAQKKYDIGMKRMVYKPGLSITEYFDPKLLLEMLRMDLFKPFDEHIRKFFSHQRILKLMEFPILFLGSIPQKTPALFSLMNYADMVLGTWYPMGGFNMIISAMVSLAKEKGVQLVFGEQAISLHISKNKVTRLVTDKKEYVADAVISGADYHYFETKLVPEEFRNYDEKYWDSRVMAPSALLFYLGLNTKVEKLLHHNMFFHEDFDLHAEEIYETKRWPSRPLFYVSAPSKTDPSVAPEGHENIVILMPVAPGLHDTPTVREQYYNLIMKKLEVLLGQNIKQHVVFKRSYAHNNFFADYHAYKGNAYGLANTINQTAIKRPSIKNKKLSNLYYTGQLTVPGPGVPPALISGMVVSKQVEKYLKH
jgi:phytoene desaturase